MFSWSLLRGPDMGGKVTQNVIHNKMPNKQNLQTTKEGGIKVMLEKRKATKMSYCTHLKLRGFVFVND